VQLGERFAIGAADERSDVAEAERDVARHPGERDRVETLRLREPAPEPAQDAGREQRSHRVGGDGERSRARARGEQRVAALELQHRDLRPHAAAPGVATHGFVQVSHRGLERREVEQRQPVALPHAPEAVVAIGAVRRHPGDALELVPGAVVVARVEVGVRELRLHVQVAWRELRRLLQQLDRLVVLLERPPVPVLGARLRQLLRLGLAVACRGDTRGQEQSGGGQRDARAAHAEPRSGRTRSGRGSR